MHRWRGLVNGPFFDGSGNARTTAWAAEMTDRSEPIHLNGGVCDVTIASSIPIPEKNTTRGNHEGDSGLTIMPNLGNAWHLPASAEPRGAGAMRDPVGALVPGADITIFSGNQFRGPGTAGNQLQDGSSVFFRRPAADAAWTEIPMRYRSEQDNNKYYAATILADTTATFTDGDRFEYYLRIAYSDRDTTFVHGDGQGGSATAADEAAAQANPFSATMSSPAQFGMWGPVLAFPNAAIHTSVQPDGRVLMWGRRDDPREGMDPQHCTPFVWDPLRPTVPGDARTAGTTPTGRPERADGSPVNIFCAGHAFLPDGRLLVAGGHLKDSDGIDAALLYDGGGGDAGTWSAIAPMAGRRWYPTAITGPDGGIVVLDGSYIDDAGQTLHVTVPEVWSGDAWTEFDEFPDKVLDLYPRVHIASDGRAFVSGPLEQTWFLDLLSGHWHNSGAPRKLRQRDYAPAVMYDTDKILYIGGGGGDGPPTNQTERIDLTEQPLAWKPAGDMHVARRQHNATVLPDGTVLVTGGTRGGGFNNLDAGQPVHTAELWDPRTGAWTELAAESVDRCYHATTVLLPDATVLSAGGGEFKLPGGAENDPQDTHHNAQIFRPPYLFRDGTRPQIGHAPTVVEYGSTFEVQTTDASDITKVTLLRLAAVTHSLDQSQHVSFPAFHAAGTTLTVTAPATPSLCPPGPYMLFILTSLGIPSVASILRIGQASPALDPVGAQHATFAGVTTRGAPPPRRRRGLRGPGRDRRRKGQWHCGTGRDHRDLPLRAGRMLGRGSRSARRPGRCGIGQPRPEHRGLHSPGVPRLRRPAGSAQLVAAVSRRGKRTLRLTRVRSHRRRRIAA
jgi:hypothetical protein